jgi:soluble lytic murein transglycosylase-like protein
VLGFAPQSASAAGLSGSSGIFKVVKPPAKGARKRITIHDVAKAIPPRNSTGPRHGWFWQQASAHITDAAPDRLHPLSELAAGRLNSAAAEDVVAAIARTFPAEIAAAAKRAQISEALLIAVIAAESRGNPKAVSSAGAQGLAQLMPGTARRFQVTNAFDPAQNLRGSADYLSILLKMFGEDTLLALAGYNAGENAVIRHKGVPPYAETRDYVPIVLSYWQAASAQCKSAPTGPRAACSLSN